MGISSEFAEMMRETITILPQASVNKYGKQSYGTGVAYRCRYINSQRILRDADGREVVESGRAIVFGLAPGADVRGKVLLPNGTTPLITSVSKVQDENGDHHHVIGYGT